MSARQHCWHSFLALLLFSNSAALWAAGNVAEVTRTVSSAIVAVGGTDSSGFARTGNGVIVDAASGQVVVPAASIENISAVAVQLATGQIQNAQVLGKDSQQGLALLAIQQEGLQAIAWGDKQPARFGDFVIAVGSAKSPLATNGEEKPPISAGLVQQDNHDSQPLLTDVRFASVGPGAALINLNGELLGIVLGEQGGATVAANVATAQQFVDQISQYGHIRRGRLGVHIQDNNGDLAAALGSVNPQGAIVSRVLPGSAGAAMGLRDGDIIVRFNNHWIANKAELQAAVGSEFAAAHAELEVVRGRIRHVLNGRLSVVAATTASGTTAERLGAIQYRNVDKESGYLGYVEGLILESVPVNSPAALAGVEDHDILFEVNRQPIIDGKGLETLLEESQGSVLLSIRRGAKIRLIALP